MRIGDREHNCKHYRQRNPSSSSSSSSPTRAQRPPQASPRMPGTAISTVQSQKEAKTYKSIRAATGRAPTHNHATPPPRRPRPVTPVQQTHRRYFLFPFSNVRPQMDGRQLPSWNHLRSSHQTQWPHSRRAFFSMPSRFLRSSSGRARARHQLRASEKHVHDLDPSLRAIKKVELYQRGHLLLAHHPQHLSLSRQRTYEVFVLAPRCRLQVPDPNKVLGQADNHQFTAECILYAQDGCRRRHTVRN